MITGCTNIGKLGNRHGMLDSQKIMSLNTLVKQA